MKSQIWNPNTTINSITPRTSKLVWNSVCEVDLCTYRTKLAVKNVVDCEIVKGSLDVGQVVVDHQLSRTNANLIFSSGVSRWTVLHTYFKVSMRII